MSTLKRTTLALILVALAACSPAAGSDFTSNRQKWNDKHVTHYRFTLAVICFCAFSDQMPLTIEVQDGKVVSMVNSQGQPVTNPEMLDTYTSIDKLFEILDKALNGGADKVTVTYNSQYGYPESISIDYVAEAVDDEMAFEVSNFQ